MRTILHCDLNNFFASVECILNPELKSYPVAVCGSVEQRAGIVLAKNEIAKAMGVVTAEAIWQAKQKCHNLITVPPHFEHYENYSRKVQTIYKQYTNHVEAFGIDECWLDVTGSTRLFGSGEEIAYKIKEQVKNELGLTISVGVSFNKVFAKLGSDMKKPDAVTIITKDGFKEKIWGLPCSDMIGIGRSTNSVLKKYSILTLGDLARCDPEFLRRILGVCGINLWQYANGMDQSIVTTTDYCQEIKSCGHSTTLPSDLTSPDQVWNVMLRLSSSVSERLRKHNLCANGVQISIKTPDLHRCEFQTQLNTPVTSSLILSKAGFDLFMDNFKWDDNIRAVGIRAINLTSGSLARQFCMLDDYMRIEKLERLEVVRDNLKEKFGKNVVVPLSFKKDIFQDKKNAISHD